MAASMSIPSLRGIPCQAIILFSLLILLGSHPITKVSPVRCQLVGMLFLVVSPMYSAGQGLRPYFSHLRVVVSRQLAAALAC